MGTGSNSSTQKIPPMYFIFKKVKWDNIERALLEAAGKGRLEVVKEIISRNPNLINATDADQYTPLHRACYSNKVDIVKYLVEHGADLSALTELKWQPLHCCSHWGHADCAAVLLENGADPNALTEGGQTPLHIAATKPGGYKIVQLLLMHEGTDPNIQNGNGEIAYDLAKRSSQYYNIFEMADPSFSIENINKLEGDIKSNTKNIKG
uniref:Uncharacterized protein n=1 Tax=Dendroctonus ponderosae TaxID=77166 RepID=A0AAR5Q9P6_DENPD